MTLGYIGLGKMGKNMVFRLLEKKHQVIAWNRSPEPRQEVEQAGAATTDNIQNLVNQLQTPRIIWLMLPAGEVTQNIAHSLIPILNQGDTVIDGANSFYKNTVKLGHLFQEHQINFLDCGVSGGPSGARNGACLMIGGDQQTFDSLEPLFKDLAAPKAYQFFPGIGAGHFVKMVHNGIEYGMMQAIAEGFDILKHSDFNLNLEKVAQIYNNHSVIESRLVGWTLSGYQEFGAELNQFDSPAGSGGTSGMNQSEAKWTLDVAIEQGIKAPVLQDSIQARLDSQDNVTYQTRIINLLRNQFGGHNQKQS